MLVLTRRAGEQINIGPDIKIKVIRTERGAVAIGISAPDHVNIVRDEIAHKPPKPKAVVERSDPAGGIDPDCADDPDSCVYDAGKRCECWVRLANGKECPHRV